MIYGTVLPRIYGLKMPVLETRFNARSITDRYSAKSFACVLELLGFSFVFCFVLFCFVFLFFFYGLL